MSIFLGKTIKCRKCKTKNFKQDVYRYWHNVDCVESIISPNDLIDIAWVKNWWICTRCKPFDLEGERRLHDIDGFTYFLSWKFPFVRRG